MDRRFTPAAVLLILILSSGAAWAGGTGLPSPTGHVNDFAGVLGPGALRALEELLSSLEGETGVEVAVVTVDETSPLTPFDFGVRLFGEWGIGKAGVDNGLLILLAMEEREIRVEVGYGLEHVLTDSRVGSMLDQHAIPRFREDDMAGGIADLTAALAGWLRDAHGRGDLDEVPAAPRRLIPIAVHPVAGVAAMLGFWLLLGWALWFFLVRPTRICPQCKTRLTSSVVSRIRPGIHTWGSNVYDYSCPGCGFSRRVTRRVAPIGTRGGTFGGGMGRGGSRGGFGGFGGGRSGGGGAGRRF